MLERLKRGLQVADWQRTLYILFFSQLITAIGFSSIFPFLPLYVEDLGSTTKLSTEFLAGMVFSAQAFAMMLASPIWGTLADRYGRKLMVQRASFGGAVLLLLMAFVQSAEQLVALRAIQGLVTGVVSANNALLAAATPRKRIGYAMGLLQVSLGSGVAIGPLIGGALADAFGYRAAFYGTSALLLLAGVMVHLGVREEFDSEETRTKTGGSMLAEWRQVFATPGIITTYGMRFTSQLARMMIVPMAPLFIQTLMGEGGRVNSFIGLVLGSASAATTMSAIYLGRLGDRIGHRRILVASAVLAGLLYLPQSLVTAGWQILVLQAATGVAMGGVIPAISALLAKYAASGEEGAVYGLDNSINAAGRAAAPLLGSGVAVWFNLRATFVASGATLLLAAGLAAWLLPGSEAKMRSSGQQ